MGIKLDIDATLSIDENGVKIQMKGFNTNNFIIDKVFNKLNKKKKNDKSHDKDKNHDDLLCPNLDEGYVNDLVNSVEIEGPIVIDVTV